MEAPSHKSGGTQKTVPYQQDAQHEWSVPDAFYVCANDGGLCSSFWRRISPREFCHHCLARRRRLVEQLATEGDEVVQAELQEQLRPLEKLAPQRLDRFAKHQTIAHYLCPVCDKGWQREVNMMATCANCTAMVAPVPSTKISGYALHWCRKCRTGWRRFVAYDDTTQSRPSLVSRCRGCDRSVRAIEDAVVSPRRMHAWCELHKVPHMPKARVEEAPAAPDSPVSDIPPPPGLGAPAAAPVVTAGPKRSFLEAARDVSSPPAAVSFHFHTSPVPACWADDVETCEQQESTPAPLPAASSSSVNLTPAPKGVIYDAHGQVCTLRPPSSTAPEPGSRRPFGNARGGTRGRGRGRGDYRPRHQ